METIMPNSRVSKIYLCAKKCPLLVVERFDLFDFSLKKHLVYIFFVILPQMVYLFERDVLFCKINGNNTDIDPTFECHAERSRSI